MKLPITLFAVAAITLTTQLAQAENIPLTPPLIPTPDENAVFYEIGGGSNYRVLEGGFTTPNLEMDLDYGLGFLNGKFDPIFNIKNTLDEIETSLVTIGQGLTAAASALPGYIICRANPLMCQLMENYTVRAEEKIDKAFKYAEAMERDLAQVRSQLDGWTRIGKAEVFYEIAKTNDDIVKAWEAAREYDGKGGIKWIGGSKAGGDGQPPIRPIADTVKAGFNMLLGRATTTSSQATGTDALLDYWDTPEEASRWVAEVVGEFRPDINNNPLQSSVGGNSTGSDDGDSGLGGEDVNVPSAFLSSDRSTPALGLTPKIRKESIAIETKLLTLIDSLGETTIPTVQELSEVAGKSSNFVITPSILKTLRVHPLKDTFIRRIAEDAALANVTRYALSARRMLVAGRNEPHIAAYDIATTDIDRKIKTLERDIEAIAFERKMSGEMLSETIGKLMQDKQRRLHDSYIAPSRSQKSLGGGFRRN